MRAEGHGPEEKMEAQHNQTPSTTPPFRLDVSLHDLLTKPQERSAVPPPPGGVPQELPTPAFPQYKKLFEAPDENYFPKNGRRHWEPKDIYRSMKGWMFPY